MPENMVITVEPEDRGYAVDRRAQRDLCANAMILRQQPFGRTVIAIEHRVPSEKVI